MSDLIDDPLEGENAPEFSVSEISGAVKRVIEGEFAHVRVKGEVGRVSRPRSGHVYMDLKDDRAVLAGVIWKGVASRLSVQPEEGMEVVATGRLTTFPGQSRYQIVIEDIKPAGMGALMAMLEKRKAQLAAEGLFAPERKRPLPYLPEVIGVITSPSGAVIRDILHRLRDRFPRKVLIWPVAVQGEKCAPEVTRAIRGFNQFTPGGALPRPDLLIVARGGGSIEDLWGFNEESVVRAAAESDIPLISAVGHETDTTLIDYAADQRAPTPTAAAELAVPVRLDLLAWCDKQEARLSHALTSGVGARGQRLRDLARALPRPERLLDTPRQRLDAWSDRLPAALTSQVQKRRVRLFEVSGALRPGLLQSRLESRRDRYGSWALRLAPALQRMADRKRESLHRRLDRLSLRPIRRDMAQKRDQLDRIGQRLSDAGQRQVRDWREQITAMDRLRETLGYKATLKRGYAVVRGDGAVVTTREAAAQATALEIEFADGRLDLAAGGGGGGPGTPPKAPRKAAAKPAQKAASKPPKSDPPGQGSLF
ncbi:exodeoxyribonuclease VII large subunit [Roseovarius halotolerans]|uniref:Exodeoxyribonuclease 7 large subunit n=1 Tax=Roseovarius halotolerans TaxID=505353 RepID=A0A1X6ZEM1_9RHOB|nr:exodeoxyribonuclease VII large subunit [Roseovarius halotolerans]RKT30798.1 exodeoxyribonuclease VII large subunit [Roseovarius halotolerans]SLN49567.1 Exodeoxyribonuclease 7 large subunit [Roseovarius halotolerans]